MCAQFLGRVGPAGRHRVVLDAIEETTNDIGESLQFRFRVVGGPHAGCVFTRSTGRALLGGTSLGDLLDMFYGKKLVEGDSVDFAALVGQEYELIARPGRSSGGVFHSVRRIVEVK